MLSTAGNKPKSRFPATGGTAPTKTDSAKLSVELQKSNETLINGYRQRLFDEADNLRDAGQMPPQPHEEFCKLVDAAKLSVSAGSVVDPMNLSGQLGPWRATKKGTFLSTGANAPVEHGHGDFGKRGEQGDVPTDDEMAAFKKRHNLGARAGK